MANKQLTASVRLNTSQFEQKLRRIAKGIDALNNGVRKQQGAYDAVNRALAKSETQTKKVKQATDKVTDSTKKWDSTQTALLSKLKSSKSVLGSIGSKLKSLAATYLGIMGMKAGVGVSDTITSSQNKLNYVNAQQMPNMAYSPDGGYSTKVMDATQNSMDKMYVSSQKVRMGYTDMMSNVSKSMALAGDSFQNSTDNAIRFQEIMAEAYTIGGASAQEMHSSMYQMIQALGAGTLAGDELRSVREGAPLAYKAIEEFAQKTYDCTDSLKDMASQGKISSDMVVAAIMQSGDKMDKAFNKTKVTFGQVWTQIKNMATKAFEPVSNQLNKMLNDFVKSGGVEKLETAFMNVSKAIQIVLEVAKRLVTWIADNWGWIQHLIIGGIMLMITWTLIKAVISIACAYMEMKAWMKANGVTWAQVGALAAVLAIIAIIILAIMGLIYVFYLWKTGAIDTCNAIVAGLMIVGAALLLIGLILVIITGGVAGIPMLIAGAIVIALGLILMFFEQVCGAITWFGILCKNIALEIANFFIAISWVVANAFMSAVEFVVDIFNGCCSWISALFSNLWSGVIDGFWNFIADVVDGLDWLAKPLEKIAELFGKSFSYSDFSQSIRDKATDATNNRQHNNLKDAWKKGTNKWSAPKWDEDSSFKEKINTLDGFEKGWSQDAYNIGADWGAGVKDKINQWGSKFQTDGNGGLLDNIGEKLGLDFGDGKFPSIDDPAYNVSNAYNQPGIDELTGGVGDIADDTSKIKDSMDLKDDDLDYLRKIAEMEWRKEFTTAEIKVDMSNYNTITGERDWEGLLTYLSDEIKAEMYAVSEGVHY